MPTRVSRPIALASAVATLALGGTQGCGFRIEPDPAFTAAQAGQPAPRSGPTIREDAVQRLMVMATSPNAQVRANALEGLARGGPAAEPAVALALGDDNPGVRSVAAMVAGRSGFAGLAPSIERLLADESDFVRASAMSALFRLGEPVDPTELSAMLLESKNSRLRAHAAFLLGEMGDRSAAPLLRQAWVSPVGNATEIEKRILRLQIAEAMIKLGDQESVDSVRAALYPSRPEELEATALAVQIIGEVRDRGSIDQLIYLAEESGERTMPAEVRLAVAEALAKMGLNQGGFIADEYRSSEVPVIRAQAAKVYGRTGRNEHLDDLQPMLEDPSELVRVAAAAAALDLVSGGAQADARGGRP